MTKSITRRFLRRSALIGLTSALLAVLVVVLGACGSGSSPTPAPSSTASTASDLGTLKPGVLEVAVMPYYPYTAVKNGQLVGLDSDIIKEIAQKLNLTIHPVVTDFSGMLASVQARRVDIAIGSIYWSPERAKAGIFTDPPYYSPLVVGEASGKSYTTVASLQGLDLGTVTGYVWVQSIKQIPGATLHAYPAAPAVFDDLGAGRIAAAFIDPLMVLEAQKSRPGLHIQSSYLTPPTAAEIKAHPAYVFLTPAMTGFYIPQQEPKLQQAISAQIDAMYASGEMSALVTKWGGDPSQFLKPSPGMTAQRLAVDRPAGWTCPTIP